MLKDYQGRPYADETAGEIHHVIPGKVFLAYYDLGGEGVAYHDTIPYNQGNGALNPLNGEYHNEFRHEESVDVSYMKPDFDFTDNNFARPDPGLFYVGWTEPGEWLNYTVDVRVPGNYRIDFFCSAAQDAKVQLEMDGAAVTEEIAIPSTTSPHVWTHLAGIAHCSLKEGLQVLTLRTVETGLMNYVYLEFVRED